MNTEKWRIGLPTYPPAEVMDYSTRQEYVMCMRRGLYKYGLRRGFEGKSYPIQYGLAYHKYREIAERMMIEKESPMTDEIHKAASDAALKDWEDPPIDHKFSYLDLPRIIAAIEIARSRIEQEQRDGIIKVTRAEDSFDLRLPFGVCHSCGWADLEENSSVDSWVCRNCLGTATRSRHGGRVDQFVEANSGLYIRDWKTISRNIDGSAYDINSQLQGYVWAGSMLSGRKFKGALIETVYNTSTTGPIIRQFFVHYSSGQLEQWIVSQMMFEQMIRTSWARVKDLGYLAFPQNTNSCSSWGGCPYREACQMSSGREIDSWLSKCTTYLHWDFMERESSDG